MTFPKRTIEKPIPISPTIALDRERCILCYRCTRFSEDVAEDGQLVAREPRRALGDRDVRGRAVPRAVLRQRDRALPGRRADLDAVPLRGAAVGDPERPVGLRPLPGRLQHHRDDARGQGQAHPLAEPPRDRRGLALRQGPLRVRAPVRARPRQGSAAQSRQAALRGALLGRRARRGRAAPARAARCCSRSPARRRSSRPRRSRASCGRASARTRSCSPSRPRRRSTPSARRSPSIRDAERVIVIGDDPVEARAPVVALWIKAARRNGAEIVTVGAAGTVPTPPGGAAEAVRALGEQARGAVLIWSGPGGAGGAVVAALAEELGAASAFYLPATPNGRAVVEAWARPATASRRGRRRSARCSSPATRPPPTRGSARSPSGRTRSSRSRCSPTRVRGWADLVLPGTSYLERDGTMVNLEGRPQRLRRAVIPPAPDEIAWIAKLAERFGVDDRPARARRSRRGASPARARRAPSAPRQLPAAAEERGRRRAAPLQLVRYRSLFSGPGGRARRGAPVPAPRRRDRALAARREVRGISTGDEVVVRSNGTSVAAARPRRTGSSSTAPSARPRSTCATLDQGRGGEQAAVTTASPGGSALIKALIFINVLLISMAFLTLYERKLLAPDAAALRPEPRRPEGRPPAVRRPGQDGAQGGVRAGGGDRHPLPAWRPRSRRSPRWPPSA